MFRQYGAGAILPAAHALHGINEGESFADTMASVGIAFAFGALDGALFVLKEKLLIAGAALLKNFYGNRKDWFRYFLVDWF